MEAFEGGQKQLPWDIMAHLLTQPYGSILNFLLALKQQWVASSEAASHQVGAQ